MSDALYDAFISYNSSDVGPALSLAELLRDTYGLRVWVDRWSLLPGDAWVDCLEDAIRRSNCLLGCMGSAGQGPWHQQEIKLGLRKRASDSSFKLIPVLLPGVSSAPDLPNFLTGYTWSDLREGFSERSEVRRLVQAIVSVRQGVNERINGATTSMPVLSGYGRQIVSLQRSTRKQHLPAPLFHRLPVHLYQGGGTYAAVVKNSTNRLEIRLSPFEPRLWADLRVVENHSPVAPVSLEQLQQAGLIVLIREKVEGSDGKVSIRQIVAPAHVDGVPEMDGFLATLAIDAEPLFTDTPEPLATAMCRIEGDGILLPSNLWRVLLQHYPELEKPGSRFVVLSEPLRFMIRYLPAGDRVKRVRIEFADEPGAFQQIESFLEGVGLEQAASIGMASIFGSELDLICTLPDGLDEQSIKEEMEKLSPMLRVEIAISNA
jgi:hypothetical protein